MYFYERLKDLREDKDMPQWKLAKLLNISQQQYCVYENGKRQIPFDKVIWLAKFYDVSIDYIAGLTNDKRKYW